MRGGFSHRHAFAPLPACLLALLLCLASGRVCAADHAGPGMSRHDLVFLPAHQLAELIRTGKVTSAEAVEAYLEQIAKHNPGLNAIVTLDADGARKRAREADEALARGEVWGPLHGVPVTIKDNLATRGVKTTSGMESFADRVPGTDSTVVERVKKAGAVILGKTNLPPMGMDTQTIGPLLGATNNPWDVTRNTGGSSGGEAAAVAAGLSALGFGTDIGGSVRTPSHFCGVYGIKTTENSVSNFGNTPGRKMGGIRSIRHLTCIGTLGRCVEDLKLGLSVIAGADPRNPDIPWVDLGPQPVKGLKDLRVTWTDDFGGVPVTAETRKALKAFADKLEAAGCRVERLQGGIFEASMEKMRGEWKDLYDFKDSQFPKPDYQTAWTTYGKLMDLEAGAYQPSFFRLLSFIVGQWYRSGVPTIAMAFPQSYSKYLKTMTDRDFFVSAMDAFMAERDVLLCPVTSTPAFEHIQPWTYFGPFPIYTKPVMVDGKPLKYLVANMSYTSVFNLTGSPVVVIPIGYTKEGLPIGVQIVGKRWRDMELLGVAGQLDEAAGAYWRPAGY
jgi:amidase